MGDERFLLEELVCMHYGAFQGMYIRFLGLQFMENLFICLFFDLALLLLYNYIHLEPEIATVIVWGIAASDNRHQISYSSSFIINGKE
jgi:hypothetical protein